MLRVMGRVHVGRVNDSSSLLKDETLLDTQKQ